MIKSIIKINDNIVNYMEKLDFENERTKEIIAFMITHNYDINDINFKKWENENFVSYVKYQEAKQEIENIYINPKVDCKKDIFDWTLSFQTKELTINTSNTSNIEKYLTFKVDEKLVEKIKEFDYKCNNSQEIMSYMSSHDCGNNTNAFKQWNINNQKDYKTLENLFNDIEQKYIKSYDVFKNKTVDWELNYDTNMLYVKEKK